MRVSIDQGFHAPIQRLMNQLQTDDPKLAIQHVIGLWLISQANTAEPPLEPYLASATASPAIVPAPPPEFQFNEPIDI